MPEDSLLQHHLTKTLSGVTSQTNNVWIISKGARLHRHSSDLTLEFWYLLQDALCQLLLWKVWHRGAYNPADRWFSSHTVAFCRLSSSPVGSIVISCSSTAVCLWMFSMCVRTTNRHETTATREKQFYIFTPNLWKFASIVSYFSVTVWFPS